MPYRVISPIQHLGKSYAVGDSIELDPPSAYQLVVAKCVEEVPPPVPAELAPERRQPATNRVHMATPAIRKD